MSTPGKYHKYDKGRFVKPISRKVRTLENKKYQEKLDRTRANVNKWIDSLPDPTAEGNYDHDKQDYDFEDGNCQLRRGTLTAENDTDVQSNTESLEDLEVTGATGGVLNRGFCNNNNNNSCSLFVLSSPVKCDVSVDNLLPQRLRERKTSGLITGTTGATGAKTLTAGASKQLFNPSCEELNPVKSVDNRQQRLTVQSVNATSKMEVKFKCPKPIEIKSFEKESQQEKMGTILSTLNGLCLKLEEIDVQNNHDTDGLQVKLETVQSQADSATLGVAKLKKDNGILRGLVQRQFNQIRELNEKVAMLTARSMQNNVTISGLEGDGPKEKYKDNVINFLKEKVGIEVDEDEILVAH